MPRNNMKREPIPKHFRGVEAAAEFWDSHDLTDYWGSTRDAHFRVDVPAARLPDRIGPGAGQETDNRRSQTGHIY